MAGGMELATIGGSGEGGFAIGHNIKTVCSRAISKIARTLWFIPHKIGRLRLHLEICSDSTSVATPGVCM